MTDYTYQSVFFSYFLFILLAGGALYYFIRSIKDGYLGRNSEEPKHRMLRDDDGEDSTAHNGAEAPRSSR